jgi:methionyl-tRNA formyltransferase
VVGVIAEEKTSLKEGETKMEDEIIRTHFFERSEAEKKYFSGHDNFVIDEKLIFSLENGQSNSLEVFEWVKEKSPDFVILFGSSIIKPPLLSYYDGKIINIHLGLSPYYRGSGTNFWPLVNNQPECVGATIHLAILKVDAGSILGQIRPDVEKNDLCHDVGCKTIINGTNKMIECINSYGSGEITPRNQNLKIGQICRRSDFNAQAVLKMRNNFDNGMIDEYINNKEARDSVYPIIN